MSTGPASPNKNLPLPPGLPPVAPPTAKFVVQLFLVPALIVAFLVVVAMGFQFFFGLLFGTPSPEQFLKRLDDPNAEVRWRAAADLSQVLLRDEHLASDSDFGLKLADRLQKAHTNSLEAEASFAKRVGTLSADDAERERKKLEGERNYIGYLSASLGNFMLPIGVPVLKELATQEEGMEPKALFQQQCQAVWALIMLGDKCKRFDKFNPVEQDNIIARLDEAAKRGEHADWATSTVAYLKARQAGQPTTLGVEDTLATCAGSRYPYLRELAAMALNLWSGTPEENERIEKTLVKLSHDTGDGEEEQKQLVGDNPDKTATFTHRPGHQVCYNATVALARRGSSKTRVGMLAEMLNPDELREVFRVSAANNPDEPDEAAVVQTLVVALQAVTELHQHQPALIDATLRDAVAKLTSHPDAAVANEAKKTQLALGPN
jgi:hypothetical protein